MELSPESLELEVPRADRDAFVGSKDEILSLDPTSDLPQLTPWSEATCRRVADDSEPSVEIGVRTSKDLALLPEMALGGPAAVSVDVTAPAATTLLLFYQLDPQDDYRRRRSVLVPLEAGRNRVYLRLDQPGICGRLGLRPGAARGSYLLHGLEIRRLPAEKRP